MTASARGPSARAASAATSDESTPPEKATITRSSGSSRSHRRAISSLVVSVAMGSSLARGRERARPYGLHRAADALGGREAVVMLGREVDELAVEPARA